MKILFLLTLYLSGFYIFSQAPEIQWQNTIGGTLSDNEPRIRQTPDGGYIIGGSSQSDISGDKTEADVGGESYSDFWVIKLDAVGNIEWQNTIGGSDIDYMNTINLTSDGGYIIGGNSYSDSSGDKEENQIGNSDIWIVKLDSVGLIEWENTIGGTGFESLSEILETSDGGYILSATSDSNISGDKSENSIGENDYWVIKLNSLGDLEWQNTIGGEENDYLYDLEISPDGGYILGGKSYSGMFGDKTEGSQGSADYWIIKINTVGNIEWQNTIGGDNYDVLTEVINATTGGFLIGGYSESGISGDKTDSYYGYRDFWVIKIDFLGNIEWQNTFGGADDDYLCSLDNTIDGGYIVGGYSYSGIFGNKTVPKVGYCDYWIIKLDNTGNDEWQKVMGGNKYDFFNNIEQTIDGGYITAGFSVSGISGHKDEGVIGGGNTNYDYWIIKLEGTPCIPAIEICNTIDDNCNGIIDEDINYLINISAAGPTTFCQGNSVILNATTSGPNYQWKKNGVNIPGAIFSSYTVTTKGTYTCQTSSACDTDLSAGIFVNVQKNPPASITAGGATTFCAGGSVMLTANTGGGLSYKWYKDAVLIPGATSINYTATTAGFYKCNVTKTATGCNKNSNGILVTVPCKEGEDLLPNSNFTIFPNPNTGTFNLVCNSLTGGSSPLQGGPMGGTTLEIFNSLGQQIYSQQINSTDGNINETISINNLTSGIYFVRLQQGDNYSEQKLIIN